MKKRIFATLALLIIPLLAGLLLTYEIVKIDFVSFMEVQPSHRPMEAPLPLPENSVPVQGEVLVQGSEFSEKPVPADDVSLQRGRLLYEINCALCHGADGQGDGPVAKYLTGLENPPSDLTGEGVHNMDDGGLFLVITNGVPGSMPALRENLTVRERWDIVNYVRALQE